MSHFSAPTRRPRLHSPHEPGQYSVSLARSIEERDAGEWHASCSGRADTVMDPRFLRAVERSMGAEAEFRNILFRDPGGVPVGAAFLSIYPIDGLLLAPPRWKKWGTRLRRLWPGFLKVKVLFCGCPVSTGESHLRMTPQADPSALLAQLDRLMVRLARAHRTRFVVFKEFGAEEIARTDALLELDYVRADSLPMNYFPARFCDFDHFCASVRSRYRTQIRRSRNKFARSGLRVQHLSVSEGIDRLYTEEVHRLYLSVLERAEVKLECLPAEFFRELARQFPEEAAFTWISQGERVVGFVCSVRDGENYYNLFCGYDHELNAATDLYFNLMYEDLDYALRQNVRSIHVGQTANEFKSRMGCYLEPRYFYVKALVPGLQPLIRAGRPYLFPPAPLTEDRNLFRE